MIKLLSVIVVTGQTRAKHLAPATHGRWWHRYRPDLWGTAINGDKLASLGAPRRAYAGRGNVPRGVFSIFPPNNRLNLKDSDSLDLGA